MIWAQILQRCNNPKNPNYRNYGARGIKVCENWLDFTKFFADMGPRPGNMSIERRDNNGNYTKNNCIWANRIAQASNTRRTIKITHNGKTMPLAHWAKELGISENTLYQRYYSHKNMPVDKLLSKPKKRK